MPITDPLNEDLYVVADKAKPLIDAGAQVYQKFTCAQCGKRQTMDIPNVFYTSGSCEECGHITNIEEDGCGFLLIT